MYDMNRAIEGVIKQDLTYLHLYNNKNNIDSNLCFYTRSLHLQRYLMIQNRAGRCTNILAESNVPIPNSSQLCPVCPMM